MVANPGYTVYPLVIFHDGEGPMENITRALVAHVGELSDKAIKTPPDQTEIDLWLQSPGGDAHAAYKLLVDLRPRCRLLRVLVPDYAKSAATLIALGADELFMGPSAELGPLDAQVSHPHREDVVVSALDIARALEVLHSKATMQVIVNGPRIREGTGVSRLDALRETLHFTAELFRPVMERVDAPLLLRATKLLEGVRQYATQLFLGRRTSGSTALDPSQAKDTIRRLVHDYNDHGYVICRDEVAKLGFPVGAAENHPSWDAMHSLWAQQAWTTQHDIRYLSPIQKPDPRATLQGAEAKNDDAPQGSGTAASPNGHPHTHADDAPRQAVVHG